MKREIYFTRDILIYVSKNPEKALNIDELVSDFTEKFVSQFGTKAGLELDVDCLRYNVWILKSSPYFVCVDHGVFLSWAGWEAVELIRDFENFEFALKAVCSAGMGDNFEMILWVIKRRGGAKKNDRHCCENS